LRDLGDGSTFDRDNDKGDVSAIFGAAEAMHGLANSRRSTSDSSRRAVVM
jgi:hypothetical protein